MIVRAGGAPGSVIRCTLSDLLFADLSVSVVFCYRRRLDEDLLVRGLSRALRAVPAFAGRLRPAGNGGLEIVCDDAGAALTFADVPQTVPEALGRMRLPECGLVDYIDAPGARSGGAPLLTVRVSRLADGGCALGCSWHHAVGDMSSFMTLMRAWSNFATQLRDVPDGGADAADADDAADAADADEGACGVTDRDAFLDAVLPEKDSGRAGFRVVDQAEAAVLVRTVASATRANRTVQFYFGEAESRRLRERLAAVAGRPVSANDAVTAHIVTTTRILDRDAAERYLTIPVDLRRFLGIPARTIGNLLGEIHLRCAGDEADRGSGTAGDGADGGGADGAAAARAGRLAARIRDAVEDFGRSHLSLRTNRAVLAELGPERLGDCVALGFDPSRRAFTASSWRGFGVYDVVFDGTRPAWFSPAISLPLPWVCWLVEGFDGVGTLCTLAVPAALAQRLRSAEGRALMHRHREPGEPLPELAASLGRPA